MKKYAPIRLNIVTRPEHSVIKIDAEYGMTISDLRKKLAERIGISADRIRILAPKADGSEVDITLSTEPIGYLVDKYGRKWYVVVEEPYGVDIEEAIEAFREDYENSEINYLLKPLTDDPGRGVYCIANCQREDKCTKGSNYYVFILPSLAYPTTEPMIFVSPKVRFQCCFHNLDRSYFLAKASSVPQLSQALQKVAQMLVVNACVIHFEDWDYLRRKADRLKGICDALCTDAGLCYG